MLGGFRKLFSLYPGEGRKALPFLLLAFVWAVGGYGGFTLSEGLFLEKVGSENLPGVYAVVGSSLCLTALLLITALRRFSVHHLFLSVIGGSGLLYGLFTLFLATSTFSEHLWFWYAFKATGWVVALSSYIIFWAYLDQYFDLQAAKRFFCLFNAITFLGDAVAGGIIAKLLGAFGPAGVMLISTLCIVSALPIILFITQNVTPSLEAHQASLHETSSMPTRSLLGRILRSRYTLLLMLFYFLMQVLAIVTEFTYMEVFENHFQEELALTEFIGVCAFWVSLGNMVFGLVFYSRLLRRLGLGNIIVVAPAFFLSVYLLWMGHGVLGIAILALVAREGMVYTFDDNNLQLLVNGVPTRIKNQVRIGVESFLEPLGMLSAALLLILFKEVSKPLGLILALAALATVFFVRAAYSKAIFRNLVEKEEKVTQRSLLHLLKKGNKDQQLHAFKSLLKMSSDPLLSRLLSAANRFSLRSKIQVIELLEESPFAHTTPVMETFERWRRSLPHPTLLTALDRYTAKLPAANQASPETLLEDTQLPYPVRLLAARRLTLNRLQLEPLLQFELRRALFLFYHAHTLEERHPELTLSPLSASFQTAYATTVDFCIQLIAHAGKISESSILSEALQSAHAKTHAHALETLQRASGGKLFALVAPLFTGSAEEKISLYLRRGGHPLTLPQLLKYMRLSPFTELQSLGHTMSPRFGSALPQRHKGHKDHKEASPRPQA